MLALHLLQSSLLLISTQLLQAVLRDLQWAGKLTVTDRRGLSPLFLVPRQPVREFHLDMDSRLDITRRWAYLGWPGCPLLPVAVMRRRPLPRRALSFR